LRNQPALLGTAGLVGSVNPSTLRQTPGSTLTNPIVVKDPPRLDNRTRLSLPVDTAVLPTPSVDQIVESLIAQKNIFPVLESVFKLVFDRNTTPSSPMTTSHRDRVSPLKKRKLKSVPAGAADWDVPYPFPEGEGPPAYRTNWEKERGKQLITHLVGLIKDAAKGAAMKTYLRQQREQQEMAIRPEASKLHENGVAHMPVMTEMLADCSNGPMVRESLNDHSYSSEQAMPELDPSIYDSWMEMLGSISFPGEGEGNARSGSGSAPPTPFNIDPSIFPPLSTSDADGHETTPDISDIEIDPSLLWISDWQKNLASSGPIDLQAPALPLSSLNSQADFATPNLDSQSPEGVYPPICQDQFWSDFFTNHAVEDDSFPDANATSSQSQSVSKSPSATNPEPTAVQPPTTVYPDHLPIPETPTSVQTRKRPSVSPGPVAKGLAREEILGRARERRRQLMAEIERAKVELWETTIEQGVLSQLIKDRA
jgi:hypothetical protein